MSLGAAPSPVASPSAPPAARSPRAPHLAHYDVAIIGAGMSGLAAAIRLAHFGQRVVVLERHSAPGGLNSFYFLRGRKFDVGLHALTNFVPAGVKGTALQKLLRQLRISRDELALCPQRASRVVFGSRSLRFSNTFALLESEVAREFPHAIDRFRALTDLVRAHNELDLNAGETSARAVIRATLDDPLLEDMLLCPLMYYGSSRENDMDLGQFVIMFKALFLEGFARPMEGVRRIVRVLRAKLREAGAELALNCGVQRLIVREGRVERILLDSGDEITARCVLSCAGAVETDRLRDDVPPAARAEDVGRLSFVETISVLDRDPSTAFGWDDTIAFFNSADTFHYQQPDDLVDPRSGVICFPSNFDYDGALFDTPLLRVTCLARHAGWAALDQTAYNEAKRDWFNRILDAALAALPPANRETLNRAILDRDMFTPRSVERFTGHLGGAVYGATAKEKTGRTALPNLFLCGTDQGFLGIIGAMLSGISMANLHVLEPAARAAAPTPAFAP